MPDLEDMNSSPYQFLERMSTEKLKSIVRADFESGDFDDTANDEFIIHVLEVIAQREEANPEAPHFDVEAGWKNFQENYCPTEGQTVQTGGEQKFEQDFKLKRQADLKAPQPKQAGHRFLRIVAIAAAVVCLCAATASAFEINIFKMLAQWTQDTFHFYSEEVSVQGAEHPSGTTLEKSQTLETALEEAGVTQLASPKWIPDGFALSSLTTYSDIADPMFTALYEDEETDRTIIVSVIVHKALESAVHEKDERQVAVYEANGIDHYIMGNNDMLTATWFVDHLECSIMGEISEKEMEAMINSIYGE